MLRKTFVVLATTLALSSAFAADAMARGGGHGGPSGGVGTAGGVGGTAGGVGHGIAGVGGVGVGTGGIGGIGGVGHASMGLASLPATATPTANHGYGGLGTACNYAGPNRASVYPWCNP